DHAHLERRIARLADETARGIGVQLQRSPHIVHDFLGEDYGIPTRQTIDAIKLLAATEGIVCDPVYSGKALGGLIEMLRAGAFVASGNVIFVHTGGVASLPVYRAAF